MAKTRVTPPPTLPANRRRFGLKQLKEGLYDPGPNRKKKDAAKATPPPLTLADITIAWEEGSRGPKPRTHYVTGETLARLVHTLRLRNPYTAGHDPLAGEGLRVPIMLRGLSHLVFPDPGAPVEDLDKDVRFTVSELLHDLGAVAAVEQTTTVPKDYRVHVGPIPAEWTK